MTYCYPLSKKSIITSPYGPRTWKDSKGKIHKDFHRGNDLRASAGTKVYSEIDGTVVRSVYRDKKNGSYVALEEQSKNFVHCNWHIKPSVKLGAKVKRGQVIGTVLSISEETVVISGSHLHYEVRVKNMSGTPVDSKKWLDKAKLPSHFQKKEVVITKCRECGKEYSESELNNLICKNCLKMIEDLKKEVATLKDELGTANNELAECKKNEQNSVKNESKTVIDKNILQKLYALFLSLPNEVRIAIYGISAYGLTQLVQYLSGIKTDNSLYIVGLTYLINIITIAIQRLKSLQDIKNEVNNK